MEGVVPERILYHPKRGFAVPLQHWCEGPLTGLLAEVVDPARIGREGILRPETVSRLLADKARGGADALWLVFAFELWRREHFG